MDYRSPLSSLQNGSLAIPVRLIAALILFLPVWLTRPAITSSACHHKTQHWHSTGAVATWRLVSCPLRRIRSLPLLYSAGSDFGLVQQSIPDLTEGLTLGRELAGGEIHAFQVTLVPGQCLRVAADQRGIDILLKIIGPHGQSLVEMDSPNSTQGPEVASVIAEQAGRYRVEISSLRKKRWRDGMR